MFSDAIFIFQWWFLFFLFGFVSIPLTWIFFKKFTDLGYGFAKTIGFLVITFVAFLLALGHISPLTNTTLYAISVLYLFLNVFLFWKNKKELTGALSKNLKTIITQEVLFTLGLVFWAVIRGYQPDINGLEKFMDFGFINSILATDYLPPPDMWFSGNPINYYWFGHLSMAVITKLSSIPSLITYNLSIAAILGLTLTGAFSIASSLVKNLSRRRAGLKVKLEKRTLFAAGLISAILLTFAGSFHAPIYALKEGPENYWYPDATRFIGYSPETQDKTIHEFPIYSFVVSDLHAHLINLPFVLLFIALLLNYVVNTKPKQLSSNPKQFKKFEISKTWRSALRNSQNLIPLGFILGIMFMTNTWDFGNYLLVSGVTLTLFNLKNKGVSVSFIVETAKSLIIILVIGLLVALPFILNFETLTEGISLVNNRTPLWQLGVLWGFPAVLTTIFLIIIVKLWPRISKSDLFVLSLFIASWILIAIPEIIFVKDIYIASHQRANTMFKLTYQAFVMFYLSSGYIAVRALTSIKRAHLKIIAFIFFVGVFSSILIYPNFAINSFYGELKNYRGLAGDTWFKDKYPSEHAAAVWLKGNTVGQPTILEAPGDSYTEFNVISSYTGFPTVSGWFVHEWLWRGGSGFPRKRVSDIDEIYTGNDPEKAKNLLEKYRVEYIIVGTFERQKYPNLNEEKFPQLGSLAFSSGDTRIYQIQ
ncbi:MAG: DUF2298 domain-containing protein [Patescibacteria group bacterium]